MEDHLKLKMADKNREVVVPDSEEDKDNAETHEKRKEEEKEEVAE